MTKLEIIEKLNILRSEMQEYADYLETYTYAPYETVNKFSNDVKTLIKEIEKDI